MAVVESETLPASHVAASSSTPVACSSSSAPTSLCTDTGPPPSLGVHPPIETVEGLNLSSDQLQKVRALRAVVDALPIVEELQQEAPVAKEKSWLSGIFSRSNSSSSSSGSGSKKEVRELTWEEVLWLSNDLILWRYLRSYNWEEAAAQQQLMQTVQWRRERKPHHIQPEEVMGTAARGSVYRRGFDVHGHPIVYFKPGREPAQSTRAAQDYTLYTLEKALQSVPVGSGRDQVVFLVDFAGFRVSQVPSMDVSREVVQILNEHYTDILAKAFLLDAPGYLDGIWRLVRLMLHPLTAAKVEFINTSNPKQRSKLTQQIPLHFLEQTLGGTCEAAYNHEVYWEAEAAYHQQIQSHNTQTLLNMKSNKQFLHRTQSNSSNTPDTSDTPQSETPQPPATPAATATATEDSAGAPNNA